MFLCQCVHCNATCTSRLDIPGEDVARQFVLDLGVFLVSVVTLVIDIFVVVKLRRPPPESTASGSSDRQSGADGATSVDDNKKETEIEAHHVDSERGTCMCTCEYIYSGYMYDIVCVYTRMHYEYRCGMCTCTCYT